MVVGIVLAYLHSIRSRQDAWVWAGVIAGCAASAVLAVVFTLAFGRFEGRAEEIYEGVVMLAAAALISWMLLWMIRQKKHMRKAIELQVAGHLERNHPLGIFLLVFFSVLREGVETVIFLQAAYLYAESAGMQLVGALAGIVVAVCLVYLFFKGLGRLGVQRCFSVTTALLLLFAAGLVAHGVHELQEAGLLPLTVEHVWDINPPVIIEGEYPALHENGVIGGLLKGVFGYNGNPSLLEVAAYIAYVTGMAYVWRRVSRS